MAILFVYLFLALTGYSQDTPRNELVTIEEVKFGSSVEKEYFMAFLKGDDIDFFDLFCCNSNSTSKDEIQNHRIALEGLLSEIRAAKIDSKKDNKKIKIVHKLTHNTFLKKYNLRSGFSEIFDNGSYNCVSASALFAIIFNELKIPYTIKESPTHVYLVAFPETHRILVETTDPVEGYIMFDENMINKYVDQLKDSKIVDKKESDTLTNSEIFDQYYFSEKDINLRDLLSIHYTNDGIFKHDDGSYFEAYRQFEKAYLLSPSSKASLLLITTLASILETVDYSEIDQLEYVAKLSRYLEYGVTVDNIVFEFERITDEFLVNRNNVVYYDSVFLYLKKNISDSGIVEKLSFIYYFEKGRTYMIKGAFSKSLEYSEKAYQVNKENIHVQSLFIASISENIKNENSGTAIIKVLERYLEKYPDLKDNQLFSGYLLNGYILAFGQSYEMSDKSNGEKYRNRFEQYYENNSDNSVIQSNLVRAYSNASVYYFRKNNIRMSKQMLNKGLEYVPDSFELKNRLRMLE